MGFLDGLVSALTNDYTGTDASNGSKLGSALGNLLKQSAGDLTPNQDDAAYDGTILAGGSDGNFKKNQWLQLPNDELTANFLLNTFNGKLPRNYEITKLFGMSEWDAEENQISVDLAGYMVNNYRVNNRDAFSHIVLRQESDAGFDGWVVYSYFQNKEGWLHSIYYFMVEYR
jgi:hypothetical protein